MSNQMDVVRAKLARIMAAKKHTDGIALHREDLKAQGDRESEAARRAEAAAKAELSQRRAAKHQQHEHGHGHR